ncbi:MFS transporter [Pectinatus haikarae]|uniref:ACS family glucarate transporter-like MFS transporter n=1 Tax=Pectinatus haikarae TaxID=349096 RepID=A0ABT9Y698_9FIRM|nr:MFS transporter [Pectinatus haikarae]MDQ0203358.1 ACS family glucarate transporter-like MFS transporter [Pectinatus haikarae]
MVLQNSEKSSAVKPTKARYVVALLMVSVIAINYLDRTVMSAAAPAMMKDLNIGPSEMGYIMSMFFFSYALCQIPSGWLADKLGQKMCLAIAVLWWSVATALTAGARSVSHLISARLFMGMGESGVYPCNAGICAKWFPDNERGKVAALFDSGSKFGTAFTMPFVTWMVVTYGWQLPFIISGSIGLVWIIAWLAYYNDPERSKFINSVELNYIRSHQAKKEGIDTIQPMKWYQLLKYRNVRAMCLGFFCLNYAIYFFVTWFPTYLVHDRGLQMTTMGWLAMLPPLSGVLVQWFGGWFTDHTYKTTGNLTRARKINLVAGMFIATSVAFAGLIESTAAIMALLCFSYAGLAFAGAALWSLPGDVAPRNMTSVLGGIQNCAGNIGGILGPIITGYIITSAGNFIPALVLSGIACLIGALSYGLGMKELKPIKVS